MIDGIDEDGKRKGEEIELDDLEGKTAEAIKKAMQEMEEEKDADQT